MAMTISASDDAVQCGKLLSSDLPNVIVRAGGDGFGPRIWEKTATVQCFNPLSSTWSSLHDLPEPLSRCGVVVTDNNQLFVIGGRNHNYGDMQSSYRYDASRDVWQQTADLQNPRGCPGAVFLHDHIYAVGGCSVVRPWERTVECYSPNVDRWCFVADLPVPLDSVGTVTRGGRLYTFGGESPYRGATSLTFCYDPRSDYWSQLPSMVTSRRGCVACVAPGGLIYVIGGETDAGIVTACVEAFDPRMNQWMIKCEMTTPRWMPGIALLHDKIYVLGGQTDNDGLSVTDTIEFYDKTTDSWRLHDSKLHNVSFGHCCAAMHV